MIGIWISRLTGKPPKGLFKLGDKVKWAGHIGTVISNIKIANGTDMIQVLLMGPKQMVSFHLDGRFLEWHKEPQLVFLDRPRLKRIKSKDTDQK